MKYLSYSLFVLLLFFLTCCQSKSVKLVITASYEESKVYIDEEFIGTTDLEIMVTPGEHTVTVIFEDQAYEKKFTFAEESSKFIKAELTDILFLSASSEILAKEQGESAAGRIRTVAIGNQIWAAKNLNLKVDGSSCYDNKASNCRKYGRLYTWEAAKRAADLIPGWHLPTDEEWDELCEALGGTRDSDGDCESVELQEGGSSGFNALLAGGSYGDGVFFDLGGGSTFWSASPSGGSSAFYRRVLRSGAGVYRDNVDRTLQYSVRLVKD